MEKRLMVILLAAVLVLGLAACSSDKKEDKESEKAQQEEQQKESDQDVADALTGTVNELSDSVTLRDETTVASLREQYDALTDEQKALVPAETVEKLEAAEARIKELNKKKEEKAAKRKADKEAAMSVTKLIKSLPNKLTLKSEDAVTRARSAYDALTDDQKNLVDDSSLSKLTSAENAIKKLTEEKEEKEAKKAKAKEEKKKAQKDSKKSDKSEKKKEDPASDKYATAKKYIGKKATALTGAIGKPKSKKKNPNCSTDGEAFLYFYDGFYVGVESKTMDSPLIVKNVEKN